MARIDWFEEDKRISNKIETEFKKEIPSRKKIYLIVGITFALFLLVLGIVFYLSLDKEQIEIQDTNYPQTFETTYGILQKDYNLVEEKVTLTKEDKSTLSEIKLITPKINKVGAGYQKVAEIEFTSYEDFKQYLSESYFELYDLNNNMKPTQRQLDFKYLTTEPVSVDDFTTNCIVTSSLENGTKTQSCSQVKAGSHLETKEAWKDISEYAFKLGEPVKIGIFTDVQIGDSVEWIPTIYGVKIQEWATWSNDLNVGLVAYYTFNDTTSLVDSSGNGNTATNNGATNTSGLIGSAYNFTTNDYVLLPNMTTFSTEATWNAWVRLYDIAGNEHLWSLGNKSVTSTQGDIIQNSLNTYASTTFRDDRISQTIPTLLGANNWVMITITQTTGANGWRLYVNGTNVANDTGENVVGMNPNGLNYQLGRFWQSGDNWLYYTGSMDEAGLWNRTLTQAEVTQLYNSGNGISWQGNTTLTDIDITLFSPTNETSYINLTQYIEFSANLNTTNLQVSNATIEINYTNGTLAFSETNLSGLSGNYTFNSTMGAGDYLWKVYAYGNDSIRYDSEYFTFNIQPFEVTGESFNNFTLETDSETFYVNITTINDILSTSINLNYNGTSYFTETNCVDGSCELMQTIDLPLVISGDNENKTFFWELRLFGLDGTVFEFNTTSHEQNVSRIYLNLTNTLKGNTTLNFTTWRESNRTYLTPMSFKATFDTWLGSGTVKRTNSFQNTSANSGILLDISQNRTFYTNAFIEYNAVGVYNGTYNTRNYHFQNASLVNQTGIQNIRLFLLEVGDSTSFIQSVVDTSQLAQVGVLIFQQRYYPETDEYETVSISKTDNSGKSVGFYKTEIPDYRHLITSNGTLLKTTERGKIFPETSPFTLIFTIGETFEKAWETFQGISNIESSLTYNETTNIITYQWIDTTGALSIANLTVDKVYGNQSNVNFCSKSSALTAGILTCNVSGEDGTFIAKGYIGRSPSVLDQLITFTISTIKSVLAQPFLFLWILFLIAAIGLGLFFPPAGIVILAGLLILGTILGIVGIGWIFTSAIIGVIVWILIETS